MRLVARSTFSVPHAIAHRFIGVLLSVALGFAAASAHAQPPTKSDTAKAPAEVAKTTATETVAGDKNDSTKSRRARREHGRKADEKTASTESISSSTVPTEQLECRSMKVTGSRLGRRICATPASWAAADAKGEESAHELRRTMDASAAATSANNSPYILGGP